MFSTKRKSFSEHLECLKDTLLVLLRSEIQSGTCAKLRTVAASNNRVHASQSLLLLLARATYMTVLFFVHIPFVVNYTINATPPERSQQCLDKKFTPCFESFIAFP